MRKKITLALLVGATLAMSACFDGLEKNEAQVSGGNGPPAAVNNPPTITGAPPRTVLEGEDYDFIPAANDADGDALVFSIARKPSWANFDPLTGRLSGTPGSTNVGNFTNIRIAVSDGTHQIALQNFDITVDQIAFGTTTISWLPPTENSDGSTLTNLAGFRIYYGRSPNLLNHSVVLNNPGLTRYVVENLTPAIWHFSMTAINANGEESPRTPPVSKTVT